MKKLLIVPLIFLLAACDENNTPAWLQSSKPVEKVEKKEQPPAPVKKSYQRILQECLSSAHKYGYGIPELDYMHCDCLAKTFKRTGNMLTAGKECKQYINRVTQVQRNMY